MGYIYFYYDTERKVVDYVGITKGICRRIKEHEWYEDWVNENHIIGYLQLPDKYLSAAEYVFINELHPTRNIRKKKVPKSLDGYFTDWNALLPQIEIFGNDLRFADLFS